MSSFPILFSLARGLIHEFYLVSWILFLSLFFACFHFHCFLFIYFYFLLFACFGIIIALLFLVSWGDRLDYWFENVPLGTDQWLRLHASNTGGMGSIPGWETQQKIKIKKENTIACILPNIFYPIDLAIENHCFVIVIDTTPYGLCQIFNFLKLFEFCNCG